MHGKPAITHDAFLGGRLTIAQFASGFRSGLDAVLLAAACPAGPGDRVVEAGCGAGVALLCVGARVDGARLTGVEIDGETAALCASNAAANGLAGRCSIVSADVTGPWTELEALGLVRDGYDHSMANPPYYMKDTGREPVELRRRSARIVSPEALNGWIAFLTTATKPGGTVTLIHEAKAAPLLLKLLEGRFGGVTMKPVYTKPGAAALRILLQARKGSRASFSIAPALSLHNEDGSPSHVAEAILRHGTAVLF